MRQRNDYHSMIAYFVASDTSIEYLKSMHVSDPSLQLETGVACVQPTTERASRLYDNAVGIWPNFTPESRKNEILPNASYRHGRKTVVLRTRASLWRPAPP